MEDCLCGLYFDMAQFCQNLVIFSPLNAVLSAVFRVSGGCLVSGLHNILCPLCPAPARYNQCRQAGDRAEALALTGGCTQC